MIFGTPDELDRRNKMMENVRVVYRFFGGTVEPKVPSKDRSIDLGASCMPLVVYIYCHWYFPQYHITSTQQSVCREQCQNFHSACGDLIVRVRDFNRLSNDAAVWEIIQCDTLPWQSASHPTGNVESTCYHQDGIRGEAWYCLIIWKNTKCCQHIADPPLDPVASAWDVLPKSKQSDASDKQAVLIISSLQTNSSNSQPKVSL